MPCLGSSPIYPVQALKVLLCLVPKGKISSQLQVPTDSKVRYHHPLRFIILACRTFSHMELGYLTQCGSILFKTKILPPRFLWPSNEIQLLLPLPRLGLGVCSSFLFLFFFFIFSFFIVSHICNNHMHNSQCCTLYQTKLQFHTKREFKSNNQHVIQKNLQFVTCYIIEKTL